MSSLCFSLYSLELVSCVGSFGIAELFGVVLSE